MLKDKVVVVSGVGPGLGRSLAVLGAQQGAHIVCVARTTSAVDQLVADIASTGGTAQGVTADITSAADCAMFAAATEERFGRIDGLINNAFNIGAIATFEEVDLDDWRQAFEVNVFGTLNMIHASLPLLRKGTGIVLNINSTSALRPMRAQGGYGGSKAAMEFLTRQLAVELGNTGVRLNSIYCGPMRGPSLDMAIEYWSATGGMTADTIRDELTAGMATGEIPSHDEVARAILPMLCQTAVVVTGASIPVTGGAWIEQPLPAMR